MTQSISLRQAPYDPIQIRPLSPSRGVLQKLSSSVSAVHTRIKALSKLTSVQSHPPAPLRGVLLRDFPSEIKIEILKRCDLPEIAVMSATGIYWNILAGNPDLWRFIADLIDCPIDQDSPLPVYSQVLSFINDIQRKGLKAPRQPSNITAKMLLAPTCGETRHIHKWLIARGIIDMWKAVVDEAKSSRNVDLVGTPNLDLDNLKTSQEEIDAAEALIPCFETNQTDLASLASLNLLDTFAFLPKQIEYFTGLNELWVTNNPLLTSLPPQLFKLTGLQFLSLMRNQLPSLTPEISKLTALRTLILAENQLCSLPPEIGKLTGLDTLWLKDNRLISLPVEIKHLPQLGYGLEIDGNPLPLRVRCCFTSGIRKQRVIFYTYMVVGVPSILVVVFLGLNFYNRLFNKSIFGA